ncbi:hypothetical protein C4K68_18660 [Pokkaliibacter plantistimulans]|uniref:Uncharacterized protein n=1 Tax=Proteobacteria bacterium 228 TaxID=2083153 RepID=A0A2S5KM54_9PROT|nr:hypothetical protein [Pokkaliibacter plantistimulans]PPC75792.1 hypothetical protein C4K68_18660 [Pokkaliibacter plantistimulans]
MSISSLFNSFNHLLFSREKTASAAMAARRSDEEAQSTADTNTVTDQVTVSSDAQQLWQRLHEQPQGTSWAGQISGRQSELRKEVAREKLADIQQQIKVLKRLLATLTPEMAKGILRQLKQLAQQLKQVASVLKEDSGSSSAATTGLTSATTASATSTSSTSTSSTTDDTGQAAVAEAEQGMRQATVAATERSSSTASADEEDAELSDDADSESQWPATQNATRSNDRQRQQDAQSLQEAAQELRQLLRRIRQLLRQDDQRAQKDVREAEALLRKTGEMVSSMQKDTVVSQSDSEDLPRSLASGSGGSAASSSDGSESGLALGAVAGTVSLAITVSG